MNFRHMESAQKLRGGYYTPPDIASFLTRWAVSGERQTVLEPSCGDGAFIRAMRAGGNFPASLTCVELNPVEAAKAQDEMARLREVPGHVLQTDFLHWALLSARLQQRFDAVVGNPPFVRYQYLPKEQQLHAERLYDILKLKFTRHTNAWGPFVVGTLAMLRPRGRLAMVLPEEVLHVTHANSLRRYVSECCRRTLVIDPRELWFDDALQGVVLLLAEKKAHPDEGSEGIAVKTVAGRDVLDADPEDIFATASYTNGKTIEGKWMRALLGPEELELLEHASAEAHCHLFGEIAGVDVGIVTGANKFFLVPDSEVRKYDLGRYAFPMFGRSEHCPGVLYDPGQHRRNTRKDLPTNFLWFDVENFEELPRRVQEYVREGEKQGLHERYKCRIRKPWFKVPSVYSTPVGMLKRAHHYPRLIHNTAGALSTDTAYRIRVTGVSPEVLVAAFVNSLTALSAELEGRHYGGGVLELVPSEIEQLVVPIPTNEAARVSALDHAIRNEDADSVLRSQDARILGGIGFSSEERELAFRAWDRLRRRRQRGPQKSEQPPIRFQSETQAPTSLTATG